MYMYIVHEPAHVFCRIVMALNMRRELYVIYFYICVSHFGSGCVCLSVQQSVIVSMAARDLMS